MQHTFRVRVARVPHKPPTLTLTPITMTLTLIALYTGAYTTRNIEIMLQPLSKESIHVTPAGQCTGIQHASATTSMEVYLGWNRHQEVQAFENADANTLILLFLTSRC